MRTRLETLTLAAMTVALIVALGLGAALQANAATPMKIGIIGTGNIGGALATHWAKAGHEIVISSRHPEELKDLAKELGPKVRVGTPREAAAFGEVILLSVPYAATPQIGKDLAKDLAGKVVIDTGNPYPQRDGAMADDARKRGTGVTSAEFLPGVKLVRAFNAIAARNLKNEGNHKPERYAIPIAADDAGAIEVAKRLIDETGFDTVVVGGLARARDFDFGTPAYGKMGTAAEMKKLFDGVANIRGYKKVDDHAATAGQPTEEQLKAAAADGYKTVINLATINPRYSLPDEKASTQALGMSYHHIPVEWDKPTAADFDAFVQAMQGAGDGKVLVHCAANFRASAFYSLYAMKKLGWSKAQAEEFRASIWNGSNYPVWDEFIRKMEADLERQ